MPHFDEGSPKGKLSSADWRKIAIGAGMAFLAAGVVALADYASKLDFGPYGPIVAAVLSVLVNLTRKWASDTRPSVWLLLGAFLCFYGGAAQAAEIDTAKQLPPHSLVVVKSKTEGKGYVWFVTGPRGFEQTFRAGESCVFTGPSGAYLVMLVVSLPDGTLDQGQATLTIGDAPPVPPGPGPQPPGPTPPSPIPPDKFDNVGQKAHQWAKELGLLKQIALVIARDYAEVADGLEQGEILTINDANVELRKRRDAQLVTDQERDKWNAWGGRVSEVWNKHNAGASRADVVAFYRAISAGLGGL